MVLLLPPLRDPHPRPLACDCQPCRLLLHACTRCAGLCGTQACTHACIRPRIASSTCQPPVCASADDDGVHRVNWWDAPQNPDIWKKTQLVSAPVCVHMGGVGARAVHGVDQAPSLARHGVCRSLAGADDDAAGHRSSCPLPSAAAWPHQLV